MVVVAGFQFCLIQYGGQKTEFLHYEMHFLHVISKQLTLQACYYFAQHIFNMEHMFSMISGYNKINRWV